MTTNGKVKNGRHKAVNGESQPVLLDEKKVSALDRQIENARQAMLVNCNEFVQNYTGITRQFLAYMTDPKRDIYGECGYPRTILETDYRTFWRRVGLANRVVSIFPKQCWKYFPMVWEEQKATVKTPFEETLAFYTDEGSSINLWRALRKLDIISGIEEYGVMLYGIKDGKKLDQPVDGIDPLTGKATERKSKDPVELLFLRCLERQYATIEKYETSEQSPRIGMPTFYNLFLSDPSLFPNSSTSGPPSTTIKVHWTRIIHAADTEDTTSEICGRPRIEDVFNYLYDNVKTHGGAGESIWRAGFPGYAFEAEPEVTEIDEEKMKENIDKFVNTMQRYVNLVGLKAKMLSPTVADPSKHVQIQIEAVCATKGIPVPIFMGQEIGQLSSEQNQRGWNEQLMQRNRYHTTPTLVRPTLDRFIAAGVLPKPKKYFVEWPDLFTPEESVKAANALKYIQAMSMYLASGAEHMMPFQQFLEEIFKWPADTVAAVMDAQKKYKPQFDKLRKQLTQQEQAKQQTKKPSKDQGKGQSRAAR